MGYFTTKQGALFYSFAIDVEEKAKLDRFLGLLKKSGVGDIIKKHESKALTGRPQYSIYKMLATIIYGFSQGSGSLR